MLHFLKFKTFREFYWKRALFTLGLPWGFATGILVSISDNNGSLKGILSINTLIEVSGFTLAGFLFAYFYGKSTWNRSKALETSQEKEEQEPINSE